MTIGRAARRTPRTPSRLDRIEDLLEAHTIALEKQRVALEFALNTAVARSLAADEQMNQQLFSLIQHVDAFVQATHQRLAWLESLQESFAQMFITPASNGKARGKPPQ